MCNGDCIFIIGKYCGMEIVCFRIAGHRTAVALILFDEERAERKHGTSMPVMFMYFFINNEKTYIFCVIEMHLLLEITL